MTRDITSQLKKLRTASVNPRKEWVAHNRAQLLSQIKNTLPAERSVPFMDKVGNALSIFVSRRVIFSVMRPVAFVLVVAVTLTSAYTGTVKASYEALPGDTLYPAKRLVENIPVTMASLVGDNSAETVLRSENAKQRAVEVTKLLQTDDPDKISKAVQTVGDLKVEIATINAKLNASTSSQSGIGANTVKDVKDTTDQIKDVLQGVKTDLLIGATSTNTSPLAQEVTDAKNLVKDVSLKAVEVVVAKHLDGDTSVSKDDVTQMISSTLDSVANDTSQSKQAIDTTRNMVDAVKVEVKSLSGDIKNQSDSSLASTTKQFSDQLNNVASLTQTAADQTKVVSDAVGKTVSDAHTSLGSGDLTKAVDAIRQLNQVSKDTEKLSDATVQSSQNVLPIIQVIKDAVDTGTATSTFTSTSTPLVSTSSLNILRIILNSTTISTSSLTNTSTAPKVGATSSVVTTTADDKEKKK